MSADDVRHAVFRGRRGNTGYREPEVDAFLDRAVSVMVAVD
jgi:DivIVA domain-containing protein